jgi:hypothetical protein
MRPDCKAILIITVEVDPSIEDAWNVWYDSKHVPDVAACPGFLQGTRWVRDDENGERHYFTVWELSEPEALESAQFKSLYGWGGFEDKVKSFTVLSYLLHVAAARTARS